MVSFGSIQSSTIGRTGRVVRAQQAHQRRHGSSVLARDAGTDQRRPRRAACGLGFVGETKAGMALLLMIGRMDRDTKASKE
jgi:hypothetical protein